MTPEDGLRGGELLQGLLVPDLLRLAPRLLHRLLYRLDLRWRRSVNTFNLQTYRQPLLD